MKKTKKVLSLVLSVLVMLASVPVVYTPVTAAGTLDNPTTSVEESNPFDYPDLFKLNIKHSNNNLFFYQTIDDEYFVAKQDLFLQQYTVALGDNRTLTFHGIKFYEGGSNLADHTDTAGIVEEPAITTNETPDFMSKYYVSDSWASTHTNTQGLSCTGDVSLQASGYDLNGKHKEYTWQHSIVFKGNSADIRGQINTSYYERATWDWDDGEGNAASMDLRLKTTITVVDARDFAETLKNAQNVEANPENYSDAYVSAVKATLDNIPEDLKDFSGYYSQSIVDSFTESLASIPEDPADYSEFNRVLADSRAFTNDGTYSAKSYAAYVAQIESINSNLPKNLQSSQQLTVDEATQALLNAKELLVIEFAGTGSTANSDIEDLSPWVENEFNFIQIEDNQVFAFTQGWTMYRGTKSSDRMFYITLDTTDANTAAFAPRFTQDCVTTVPSLTAGAIEGTLSNQVIFTNWTEVDANGNPDPAPEAITDGLINPDYEGFKKEETYYLDNGLSFVGMSANETGPVTYTYVQKVYVNWTQWQVIQTKNNYATTTYSTTLNITDARALVEEYNKALNVLEDSESRGQEYITALQTLVNSIPQDMVNGTKYYTQAEVDAYYQQLVDLSSGAADYSDYNSAKAEADSLTNDGDVYNQDAFDAYKEAVENIDNALNKELTESEQLIVDNATQELLDARAVLEENKFADYADFNAAKDTLEDIVNNPDKYTSETVENAQTALDSANTVPGGMVVGENNVNQEMIDEVTDAMNQVIANAKEKADYADFNNAYSQVQDIVNNSDSYTEETVEAARKALEQADGLDKNLSADNQSTVDDVTNVLESVVANAQEKADYSDYDIEKSQADNLVNDDGNGNPVYDEDVFNAYKEAVENIDAALDKNLSASEQTTVDEATRALQDALANLEANRYYTITYYGLYGEVLGTEKFVAGMQFMNIDGPDLPADTDNVAYMGWLYPDGTIVNYQDVLNDDIGVYVAWEYKTFNIIDGAGLAIHSSTGYITSENRSLTVAEFLGMFDNDANLIEVRDYNGNTLSSDSYIGSGSTITLMSKYSDAQYETRTIVIYGDVTGDGHVDSADYTASKTAIINPLAYSEENHYFFVANDVYADGYIDALDSAYINLMVKGYK